MWASRELAERFLTVPWASPSSHALAVLTFPARHWITVTVAGALPALACEFELAGLAPGPRLISAILEYAILAGSLLSRT